MVTIVGNTSYNNFRGYTGPPTTGQRSGIRIYEVPISYYGRTYAEGKKITWRDGFKAVRVLLSVRLFG